MLKSLAKKNDNWRILLVDARITLKTDLRETRLGSKLDSEIIGMLHRLRIQ